MPTSDQQNASGTGKFFREREIATASFEPLIGTIEAASLLHIHPKTLQRMARLLVIPGHQIGRQWRFRPSELDAWLNNAVSSQCHSCR